ncbi:hypothetical protein LJC56_08380 [Christensenellaceae bacterium OttesenSCG-928-K19]|nr:hypothetical protein [Christensenellaceae bacterium OttesenSCG-928-K19]
MVRGIDTQVMLQQSINAARVAGEKAHEADQTKEFQAQLEQERAVEEMNTVQEMQTVEHRRVEEEEDGQSQADYLFEQRNREKRKKQKEDAEEELAKEIEEIEARAAARMKNVGGGVDISV